jgi:hypothetical protein
MCCPAVVGLGWVVSRGGGGGAYVEYGPKRKKNAISLNKTEEKENTQCGQEDHLPGPALFVGASTSHTVTISPVKQRDIVSKTKKKKKKKHMRGLRTCILSPHCHCLCLWWSIVVVGRERGEGEE